MTEQQIQEFHTACMKKVQELGLIYGSAVLPLTKDDANLRTVCVQFQLQLQQAVHWLGDTCFILHAATPEGVQKVVDKALAKGNVAVEGAPAGATLKVLAGGRGE